jgi:hypothetical protein
MWRRATFAIVLLLYAGYLTQHTAFAIHSSDTSGYFNAARLLGEGRLKIRATPLDALHLDDSWRDLFTPLGFAHIRDARTFAASYPLGYPIHLLLFALIGGWSVAPFLVVPVCAVIALAATYKLARALDVGEGLAIAAAVMLAVSPAWIFLAQDAMSDVPATMWCTLAVLFAVRAQRDARWAIACGIAFGIAVWVRPTDLLLLPALGFAMRGRLRPIVIASASAFPFGVAMMIVNRAIWGSALSTGYGAISMKAGACGGHHALWLAATLTPLVFPGVLFLIFMKRVPAWQRRMLASWFLTFFAFYSCYPICDAWWYLRFLLPAFPALLIGFVLMVEDSRPRLSNRATGTAGGGCPPPLRYILVTIVVITGIALDRHWRLSGFHRVQTTEMQAVKYAQKFLPSNAFVAMMQLSGTYYFYTHQLGARYDYLDARRFEELRAYLANAGEQPYALVFDWEQPELRRRMPRQWSEVGRLHDVAVLRLDN